MSGRILLIFVAPFIRVISYLTFCRGYGRRRRIDQWWYWMKSSQKLVLLAVLDLAVGHILVV